MFHFVRHTCPILSHHYRGNLQICATFYKSGNGLPFAFTQTVMKRLIDAIVIINTVLILAGMFVIRYERAKVGAAHWTPPAPPEQLDPYKHLRHRFQPAI